ncbi:MAG: STAS domain-containing protein [Spirochaetota bacterium]
MEISRREKQNIVFLDITGEIDLYNATEIKEMITKLIKEQKYQIVINLAEVSYIDSSGIGALISSKSSLKKYQGILKISNMTGPVRKAYELSKLPLFFEFYETDDEAIAAFNKELL